MKDLDFEKIGKKIKEIRTAQRLTQEYVASQTEVNVSHISNIETNKVKVSLTLLVHICNVLDTTVDYVLGTEYRDPATATERELMNAVRGMDRDKQEALLRIAKVL